MREHAQLRSLIHPRATRKQRSLGAAWIFSDHFLQGMTTTVDGRNPFRTTLKPRETMFLVFTGESSETRVSGWCRILSIHSKKMFHPMWFPFREFPKRFIPNTRTWVIAYRSSKQSKPETYWFIPNTQTLGHSLSQLQQSNPDKNIHGSHSYTPWVIPYLSHLQAKIGQTLALRNRAGIGSFFWLGSALAHGLASHHADLGQLKVQLQPRLPRIGRHLLAHRAWRGRQGEGRGGEGRGREGGGGEGGGEGRGGRGKARMSSY